MTLQIQIGGESRVVTVEPVPNAPHQFRVTLGGRSELIDVRRLDSTRLSLIRVDRSAASHAITVLAGAAPGDMRVRVPEGWVNATIDGRRREAGGRAANPSGEQQLVAPMPGKVLRVAVAAGDHVTLRQPLVTVEAMKMENELRSPKAGVVKEVAVREGMLVEAGRLLVIVE